VAYSYRIFDSIAQVDLAAWQHVRAACNASIFTDPRFIAAVEAGMKDEVDKYWHIVVRDEGGAPVACASASAMTLDLANLADPSLARIIRHIPLLSSRLRRLRFLIGGLPVGTGHHALALARPADSTGLLSFLDGIVRELAHAEKADAIVYKEFGEGDLTWTAPLLDLGYQRIATPPMHFFRPVFEDFAQYCAALKSHYRQQIKQSRRRMRDGGFEIAVLTDPQEILRAYTPEVHALYHQMVDRAALKLEILPIEFLHQLTSRLAGDVELLAIRKEARIVAFGWNIHTRSSYHAMYGGLDYHLNDELDLYFNLIYAMLDRALSKQVATIEVGLGGDAFKAKIGCYWEPLYVFAKGQGPLMAFMLRALGRFLIAHKPPTAPFNIFKENSPRAGTERRRA
jgi:Acetyltransferase (GNAT) domain